VLKAHDDELSRADFVKLATDELGWSRRTVYDKLSSLFSQKRVFTSRLSGFLNVCATK